MCLCQALPDPLGQRASGAEPEQGILASRAARRRAAVTQCRPRPRRPGPRAQFPPAPPPAWLSSWGGGPGRDAGPNPGAGIRVAARPFSRAPPILSRRLRPQPRGCPPQPSGALGSRRPALPATGFCQNRGLEWEGAGCGGDPAPERGVWILREASALGVGAGRRGGSSPGRREGRRKRQSARSAQPPSLPSTFILAAPRPNLHPVRASPHPIS